MSRFLRTTRRSLGLFGLLVACGLPIASRAAEIYGQVWLGRVGRPAVGATLRTECGEGSSAQVDPYGGYRLHPVAQTACDITIEHDGVTGGPVTVHVLDARTKADFQLVPVGGGLRIQRR